MTRKHKNEIFNSLNTKTVFLTGPRQAGKTTLALEIAKEFKHPVYLDCYNSDDLKVIEAKNWAQGTDLVILDEIHKVDKWESYLKALLKDKDDGLKLLVLDSTATFTSEQLQKAFPNLRAYTLFPLSFSELLEAGCKVDIDKLMFRGAFPDAFFAEEDMAARKWRTQNTDNLLHREIFDFKKFGNFKTLGQCFEKLKTLVGQPVSFNALSKELGVISSTVQRYIVLFEQLNLIFRISPFAGNGQQCTIARALTKRPKIYFYDTGLVEGNKEAKFENVMALSLFRHTLALREYQGLDAGLYYIRTKDGLSVDFCIVENTNIKYIAEARVGETEISRYLNYFCWKYNLQGKQIVRALKQEKKEDHIELLNAENFLKGLD